MSDARPGDTRPVYDFHAEEASAARVDRTIPFIDTHHHLWDMGRLWYPWLDEPGSEGDNEELGDYKMIRTDWGVERLLKQFYGSNVIKSVHVEAAHGGPDPVEETAWLQSIGDEYGFPHAIVVYCDLDKPGAEAELERHLEHPNVRGVRMRALPDESATFRAAYGALGKRNLSFELTASRGTKLVSGREMATRFPDVQVILGHAGVPMVRTPDAFAWWKSKVSALAEAGNVACKVSGIGQSDHDWTVESIRPWVDHCIEAFGVDRVMFGTNWPVDALYGSYLRQVDAYRTILADGGFSREDQEKLLFRNAERFYRI